MIAGFKLWVFEYFKVFASGNKARILDNKYDRSNNR